MKKANILIIDDDKNLQTVISTYLENDGYATFSAISSQQAIAELEKTQVDVVLLDLVLPDADGFDLLGKIKARTKAPVIVISGKEETMDKVVGLELGADDYITKPFELRELSARIKVAMRRAAPKVAAVVEQTTPVESKIYFEKWVLDRDKYQVFDLNGGSLDLTSGEFKLLEALVLSPNKVLTREYLFTLTRDSSFDAYDRAIDAQIGKVRRKFGDDPKDSGLIKTIRGVGYMFCGEIKPAT
ncbi:MAG: response regulator [Micavibrio sp.]|nr:response regulator [Micavibrio sp.]